MRLELSESRNALCCSTQYTLLLTLYNLNNKRQSRACTVVAISGRGQTSRRAIRAAAAPRGSVVGLLRVRRCAVPRPRSPSLRPCGVLRAERPWFLAAGLPTANSQRQHAAPLASPLLSSAVMASTLEGLAWKRLRSFALFSSKKRQKYEAAYALFGQAARQYLKEKKVDKAAECCKQQARSQHTQHTKRRTAQRGRKRGRHGGAGAKTIPHRRGTVCLVSSRPFLIPACCCFSVLFVQTLHQQASFAR